MRRVLRFLFGNFLFVLLLTICSGFVIWSVIIEIQIYTAELPKKYTSDVFIPNDAVIMKSYWPESKNIFEISEEQWYILYFNRMPRVKPIVSVNIRTNRFDETVMINKWLETSEGKYFLTSKEIKNPFEDSPGYWSIDYSLDRSLLTLTPKINKDFEQMIFYYGFIDFCLACVILVMIFLFRAQQKTKERNIEQIRKSIQTIPVLKK